MLICKIPLITRRHEGTCKILEIEESEKEGWPNVINMRREEGGS